MDHESALGVMGGLVDVVARDYDESIKRRTTASFAFSVLPACSSASYNSRLECARVITATRLGYYGTGHGENAHARHSRFTEVTGFDHQTR